MAIETFLKNTGQLVTFGIGVSIQVLGAALFFIALTLGTRTTGTTFAVLTLGGIALGLGGFAWNCFQIRCPDCGSRVYWDAVRRQSASSWFAGNLEASCPRCGRDPAPSSRGEDR